MNRKFLMAQLSNQKLAYGEPARAHWAALQMEAAYDSINALNRRYNEQLHGKWRGMMSLAPAFCALSHLKPEVSNLSWAAVEPVNLAPKHEPLQGCCVLDLSQFSEKSSDAQLVEGLGYDWQVMQLGVASYTFPAVTRDSIEVTLYTLPFWPLYKGKTVAIRISVDGGEEQEFENRFAEYSRTWKDQVMRNGAVCHLRFAVDKTKPTHTIRFQAVDPGQMLQRVIIDWGGLKPTYVGPRPVATVDAKNSQAEGRFQGKRSAMPLCSAKNPMIFADVPDLDIIRVDDTYYMVSTTMHFSPGCGIMKSKDLVNWEIINYAYDEIDDGDQFRLLNGQSDYSQGSWAANLRYDPYEKMFYMIMTCNTTGKTLRIFNLRTLCPVT